MPRHEVKTVVVTHHEDLRCCAELCPHLVETGSELSYGFGFDGLPGCSLYRRVLSLGCLCCDPCIEAVKDAEETT